jgi:membrane protease YdiL (CAAX protease family)
LARGRLLRLTAVTEGGILLLALVAMWVTGVQPAMSSTPADLALGALVGVGLAFVAVELARLSFRFLRQLQRDIDLVVRMFGDLTILDFAVVAVMAGLAEETLFRGLLQTWLSEVWGPHAAVLAASLVFGLMHAVSRSYVVFAFILGAVLGYLYLYTGSLPAAIIAHAVYDFVALVYGTRLLRGRVGPTRGLRA